MIARLCAVALLLALPGCSTLGGVAIDRISTLHKIEAAYGAARATYAVGVEFRLISEDTQARLSPVWRELDNLMALIRARAEAGDRVAVDQLGRIVGEKLREVASLDGVLTPLDPAPE